MTDLVDRLRGGVYGINRIPLCYEAADAIEAQAREIERLKAEHADLRRINDQVWTEKVGLLQEVERLRNALRMVGMLRQLGGMMPGSREVVQTVIDAADAAMEKPA